MSQTRIELKNAGFGFQGRSWLFQGVDLTLKSKERKGLTGPTGAGKSTLLRLFCGLEKPVQGELLFQGQRINNKTDQKSLWQKVQLVFQNPDDQLFCPLVIQETSFGPLNRGKSQAEATRIGRYWLERLGIEALADQPCMGLSGGEKKLVALAAALAVEPELLLLDEPSSGLDSAATQRLIKVLSGLEAGLLVVSHDFELLDKLANELWLLDEASLTRAENKASLHAHYHTHAMGSVKHEHG